jgi:hypothetical protein
MLGLALGVVVFLLVGLLRSLGAQRREAALLREVGAPLSPGPERIVAGRVEVERGAEVPVSIELVQRVKNHSGRHSTWHTWKEESRSVRASPFFLVTDDGTRVYVEPGEDVQIVDSASALTSEYPSSLPEQRLRRAQVHRDQRSYALGELHFAGRSRVEGAYRDGAAWTGWVLRGPDRGRVVLATDAIRTRYRERIKMLSAWTLGVAVVFSAAHRAFTVPFLAGSLFAERETAEVVGARTYVTRNRNERTLHHELTVRTDDGATLTGDVCKTTYGSVWRTQSSGGEPVRVRVLHYPGWDAASFVGDEATLPIGWVAVGTMGELLLTILAWVLYRQQVPWYDQRKVVEIVRRVHWVETRPRRPVPPGFE